jgi:YVTN family beta-propeller protein
VIVIDAAQRTVVTTIAVGDEPSNVAFTPDGRYAYVLNVNSDNVSVIDVATHTVVGSPIAVGINPLAWGSRFITPNIIVPTGGPLTIANDAALATGGFRAYVPFNGGTLRLGGDWTTTRHMSLLANGGMIDTNGFSGTMAGDVINDGLLTKIGAGTLTLSAEMKWGLAEGRVGGSEHAQTYILLANAGSEAATVTATFLRESGAPIVKTFTVQPTSRFNIGVTGAGSDVAELVDESFGVVLESTRPIVVERSLYSDANGTTWAAGTNATATRLP